MLQLRTFSQPNDVDNNRASHVDEKSPPKTIVMASDLGPPGLSRVSDVTQITKRVNTAVDKCRLSIRLTALGEGSIDGCFDIVDWKFIRRCDNSNRIFGLGSADSTVLHFKSFCLVFNSRTSVINEVYDQEARTYRLSKFPYTYTHGSLFVTFMYASKIFLLLQLR